jgi:hypothetical protein
MGNGIDVRPGIAFVEQAVPAPKIIDQRAISLRTGFWY